MLFEYFRDDNYYDFYTIKSGDSLYKIVKIYNSRKTNDFYTEKQNGEIGKIYKDGIGVSCNDGEIIITDIKFAGGKRILMKDYFNGHDGDKLLGKIFNKRN